jgi:20S proteasome subunit beta 2
MPGFDFSNYNRNAALHAQGVPLPKATSTGTTIVGCVFDGGVVIAADTRATVGPIVADKVNLTLSSLVQALSAKTKTYT